MLRAINLISLTLLIVHGGTASGVEAGGQRGLQTGPAGQGVAFQKLGRTDLEASVRIATLKGDERTGDETTSISGNTNELSLASGYGVSDNLNFSILFVRSSTELSGESSIEPVTYSKHSRASTTISAGPALWAGNLLLGAHASVSALGKEQYKEGSSVITIDPALIPRIKLFSGMRTGSVTAQVSSLLYNDARVKQTVYTDDAGTVRKDYKRRLPAETSLDGRLQLDQFAFAGSLTFVSAERASGDLASSDYFIYGFGGQHMPAEWLTLIGALSYTEPHYKTDEDASILADNLGGLRINIGLHYILESLIGTFGLAHTVPELVTYRASGNSEDTKIERGLWDLELGVISKL